MNAYIKSSNKKYRSTFPNYPPSFSGTLAFYFEILRKKHVKTLQILVIATCLYLALIIGGLVPEILFRLTYYLY